MKQPTDAERLEVAVSLLSERDVDVYAERCKELACEHNGFYNIPEKCEGYECHECTVLDTVREMLDCPYLEQE